MAYIELPEFKDMTPSVQTRARPILERKGTLGEIFQLLAVREDVYFATDGMVQAYLIAETELPYSTKERIALLISLENNCKMCVDVYKGIAKMLGMTEEQVNEVLDGVDGTQCPDSEYQKPSENRGQTTFVARISPNTILQRTKCRGGVFVESSSVQAALGR